jgi:DNA polymerase-3 subunit delta'
VSIVPLYGHESLRERLRAAAARGTLPSSVLLHGPRGIGKQRLALWLGQVLLCTGPAPRPCGRCQHCRYAEGLVHPDLHWYFPRPRLKDADPGVDEVRADYGEALAERAAAGGLYAPPSGTEAIFVATVRAIVQEAAVAPAIGRRKVFIIGDAERMVPQEGADAAANAFLKLLEEPPDDTTIMLTSSEPGALLPTIRSRVVTFRVAALSDAEMRAFLGDPTVVDALRKGGLPRSAEERLQLAGGAPGVLLASAAAGDAMAQARRILDAAGAGDRREALRTAFVQGGSKARGAFSDTLGMLTVLLHGRLREAVERDDVRAARGAARAVELVEAARERATGNVNPQLLSAALLRELAELVG